MYGILNRPNLNTILIDLKIQQKPHVQIHHVFKKRDSPRDSSKSLSHKTKQKVYVKAESYLRFSVLTDSRF